MSRRSGRGLGDVAPDAWSGAAPFARHRPAPDEGWLLERLRSTKIAQWILAYLAVAWLLLQLTDVLSGIWDWSIQLQRTISLVLGLGAFPALVVAWYHGERGHQEVTRAEMAILVTLIVSSSFVVWSLCQPPTG